MNLYWKMVMHPIISEIKPLNIVEVGSNKNELTVKIIEYCEDENANLKIVNPLKDQINLEYLSEYGNSINIINKNILEQTKLLEDCDVLIINLTGNYQELYNELKAVETNMKTAKFPVIFIMNRENEETEIPEENESETDLKDTNKLYVDYKDVITDLIAETEFKLHFNYLEINGNGILYEEDIKLYELVSKSVDIYCDVENENLNIRKDLEKYKNEANNLKNSVAEIKTEFEFKNNQHRSLNQRIISKFPFLYMIRYLPKTGFKTTMINIKGYQAIKKNNLLDIGYYLNTYNDVKQSGKDPITHYIYQGFKEGRNPSQEFDAEYYFETHPDVNQSKLNPLVHYALYGIKENRKTCKDETKSESYNYNCEIILNRADMSLECCIKIDEEEVEELILRIDEDNFNLKTRTLNVENDEKYAIFNLNIPTPFIDEKKTSNKFI